MAANIKKRVLSYIPVLVILGGIVAAAFYQEQVSAFFTLRLWDKAAPTRTVTDFLNAVKAGDRAKADGFLADSTFQPLEKDGKWIGYFLVSIAGTLDFKADTMAGDTSKVSEPEFQTIGAGAAVVKAPDASGKMISYRLVMKDGTWKIAEILGGVPRPGTGIPAPAGTKPAPKAPGTKADAKPKVPAIPGSK